MEIRFPAEWEKQDGILLSWPHQDTDWSQILDQVEPLYLSIAAAVSRFEKVLIIAPDISDLGDRLAAAGAQTANIGLFEIDTNDTWVRDYGPISIYEKSIAVPLDFQFNGWGERFEYRLDNQATSRLADYGLFAAGSRSVPMILEGGSIETDGKGSLLTTSRCLLNQNRNPAMTKNDIETALASTIGIEQFLWLESGMLHGDDTDAHVDILARFAPNDTILYTSCDNRHDAHFVELEAMRRELESFRTTRGERFNLVPLPLPAPKIDSSGKRLAATYANFLIINDAVLVPVYDDPKDDTTCQIIASTFPEREVIPINCLPLISQGGSLHCATMQLPEGVLA
ncbi:MAG: agmatine deiminase [Desulfuromonas sp.]|nr:MAG: agmatine deiminase [Desulfuromonas sp.]